MVSDRRTDALRGLCEAVLDNEAPGEDDVDDLLQTGRMLAVEMLRLLDEGQAVVAGRFPNGERNPFPPYVRLSWLGPWRLNGSTWERSASPFNRAGFAWPDAPTDPPITVRVPIDAEVVDVGGTYWPESGGA